MRVGINAFNLVEDAGGVSNYVLTLIREWPRFYPDDHFILYSYRHNREILDTLEDCPTRTIEVLENQEQIDSRWSEMDLFFCPFGSYWPRPAKVPCVVALMDIQERFFPEHFSKDDLSNRLFHYDWSLWMGDRIIAISDFAKDSLVRILRVPKRKIDRIYLCPDEMPPEGLPPKEAPSKGFERYIYYPANNWPHKNHLRLLEALSRLKASGIHIPCLFSGSQGFAGIDIPKEISRLDLDDQCKHLGRLNRGEVSWLFRNARLLAFPSLFEGFGIPVVEARKVGLPVLRSNLTSLPEIGMEIDFVCDPYSAGSIAEQLAKAWNSFPDGSSIKLDKGLDSSFFSPSRLIDEHRLCFGKAIRSHKPRLNAFRGRYMNWKSRNRRTELTARERSEARKMMAEQRAF